MSEPKTLLQMAGAAPVPAPLSQCALVIIDAQREYVDGRLPLTGIGPALDRLAQLLARARPAGTPIVHVVHRGKPGGLFDLEGLGGRVADEAAPETGEVVVTKSLPNAFADTELHEVLRGVGRPSLTFAGFMTHMCVSASARAALDLGYGITVAADATATRDLPDPLGGMLPADTVHHAALAALADRYGAVVPTAQIPD